MKNFYLMIFLAVSTVGLSQISEVADINTSGDADPTELYADSNSILYFRATNGTDGVELYTYDGTSVTQVRDINTTAFASGNSNPAQFIEFGGLIYFRASDGDEDDGNN